MRPRSTLSMISARTGPAFGADDDSHRHVKNSLVPLIVEKFLAYFDRETYAYFLHAFILSSLAVISACAAASWPPSSAAGQALRYCTLALALVISCG